MNYMEYHEKADRGTFDFPIQLYHVTRTNPRYEMPFHWHMECELVLVRKGTLLLLLDGNAVTLHESESILIPGGVLHGGSPQNCVYECLVFDMEKIIHDTVICREKFRPFLSGSMHLKGCLTTDTEAGKKVVSIMDEMQRTLPGYEFITTGLLWEFFGYILRQNLYTEQTQSEREWSKHTVQMKNVLRRIRTDYSSQLTLEALAAEAAMSPEYFCRIFHKITGKAPINYLNYYRIECASELLNSTDKQITEIALLCGFNDVSYFIKLFKRYKGVSPNTFRRLTQEEPEETLQ
jgi:AraC-type DNA-binding domain-containing proteins